jgi:hypothetical protein
MQLARRHLEAQEVIPHLLDEASHGPELWHQRSYLARAVVVDPKHGIIDDGLVPLAHFVDSARPDAVAIALESNGRDDPYPAVYILRRGSVTEHVLEPSPLLDFEGPNHRKALLSALDRLISPSVAQPQP